MSLPFKDKNYWALILGGSSGMGLATAKKLASWGMNLLLVHRDRRGAMAPIKKQFAVMRQFGVQVQTFNINALTHEGRNTVLESIPAHIGTGKIRVLLHSIALGNLKLIAPLLANKTNTITQLADSFGINPQDLQTKIDNLFADGANDLMELASSPDYNQGLLINEEDMAQTIYNMGTSLLTWVQEVNARNLFASDARVLGLTSEGNEVALRGYAAIAAAKSALESVSRAIAAEFAPYGIRSNIIQPGITDTPALRLIPGSKHMKANAIRRNPFGRMTKPGDVANVVALMCTDEAAWINGAIVRVDGGEHITS